MDGITNSMDMHLSEFQEMVQDWEAWHAAVHGVTESHRTGRLNNNKEYAEWINNMVLLYTTENYVQQPVINQ